MYSNISYQKLKYLLTSEKVIKLVLILFIFFYTTLIYADNSFLNKWLKNFPDTDSLYNGEFWKKTEKEFKSSNLGKQFHISPNKGKNNFYTARTNCPITIKNIKPFNIQFSFKNNLPDKIRINLWNKGDASFKKAPNMKAFRVIKTFLEAIQQNGFKMDEEVKKISSKYKFNIYKAFIGKSILEIQLEPNEYIIIDIKPYKHQKKLNIVEKHIRKSKRIDHNKIKQKFRKGLILNVKKKKNGDLLIQGIPMIDQGEKGYCAPATCARILQYYGYDLDEHQLANLMETGENTKGTSIKYMKTSLKRLASGLPFFAKELKFSFSTIERYILKGTPLIWGIPKHIRMIIGINKNKKEIIYSDSWGTKGIENRMPYKQAKNINRYLGVLK